MIEPKRANSIRRTREPVLTRVVHTAQERKNDQEIESFLLK
jgi:hypothetical protein